MLLPSRQSGHLLEREVVFDEKRLANTGSQESSQRGCG